MENKELSNNPKNTTTIRRSKHKLSVVDWWYLRLALSSIILTISMLIIITLIDKSQLPDLSLLITTSIISGFLSLCYSLINKGNLVDSVTIDYKKQEIRIKYYSLLKKEHNVTFPFEGFSWSILNGGRSQDRLRFQHEERSKIVLCEDSLGWTFEDCYHLHRALSHITPREKGLGMI